ncbi:hypothetical protein LHFGNBLO_000849 [Mesorhizobium sp. AR10]|nr:hypothetical protein LHFGNBLO_000849 [Mesorhizobium sp. AR10]
MRGGLLNILKGSGWKTRLLNPVDEFWDRRLGISTFGYTPAIGDKDSLDLRMHYEPTPYRVIFKILKHLGAGPDDVFVDFGSGMGRTTFAACWAGCGRSVGVEIDPSLYRHACMNLEKSAVSDRQIQFICTPAQRYDPSGTTIVYLFHPFGPGTLQLVVANLQRDILDNPRDVKIAYNNPVFPETLDASGLFRKTGEWAAEGTKLPYRVAFWQTAL